MPEPLHLPPLKKNPLVSILISNFNNAEYIEEAVTSALQQEYPNIEIIICDDGSTDNSLDILHSLEASNRSKLTVLKKENGGQASAVNEAFSNSKGEIVCFLDSDDFFYPEKVSQIVDVFSANSEAGFLVHRLDKIDDRYRKFGQLPVTGRLPLGWYGEYVTTTGSSPHGFPVTSGLILRREIVRQIFPVNEEIVYDLDEVIRRLALLCTNVVSIDDSLGAYRIHGKNMTSMNVIERLKKMLPVYELIWQETRAYLENISFEDSRRFPELEYDIHHLLMKYVLVRTENGFFASKELWKKIKNTKSFKSWSPLRKNFWLITVHAPNFLFEKLVAVYWESGGYKLQFSRMKYYLNI